MDATVLSVVSVIFNQTKSLPPLLLLHASGTVNTGGWTNGRLSPHVYITPPADGIWDFSFIATMPTSPAIQVVSEIESQILSIPTPEWCKGVRVHASSNVIETSTATPGLASEELVSMNWVPYPWAGGETTGKDSSAKANGDPDVFPWSVSPSVEVKQADSTRDDTLHNRPVRDLIGRNVRVYRQGAMVTMDYVPDRVNIVKSRFGETIYEIKLG